MRILLALVLVCGSATAAMAGPVVIRPTPEAIQPGQVIGTLVHEQSVELYCDVEYRRERNIHPCAVKKIVSVADPCNPCGCVFVAICVPPCDCNEEVNVRCRRDAVTFDYGKYSVRINEHRGKLIVTYLD